MTEMTNDQITRTLAEFMGWYLSPNQANWCVQDNGPGSGRPIRMAERWSPPTNRNDLAEVLAKLTPEQWSRLDQSFTTIYYLRSDASSRHGFTRWLLTCDPAIIARAVAEVVSKKENNNENKDSRDSCLEDAD